MKKITAVLTAIIISLLFIAGAVPVSAKNDGEAANFITHTVVRGDTMWKLAISNGVPLSDVIAANTHIKDPNWIYPGDILYIPLKSSKEISFEKEVIRLVNEIRRGYGLSALEENESLSRVAREKSRDMADRNYFSHQSPTYGSPFEMMKSFGIRYNAAGENIAKGYTSPQSVVDGWMNSQGHRENILNSVYTQIGVGYYPYGNYWTQMFIG